jgi:hypothetical protein
MDDPSPTELELLCLCRERKSLNKPSTSDNRVTYADLQEIADSNILTDSCPFFEDLWDDDEVAPPSFHNKSNTARNTKYGTNDQKNTYI